MTSEMKKRAESSNTDQSLVETVSSQAQQQKPSYVKPELVAYGDVRDITLGPTLGTTESGCAGVFRPGSGLPPGTTCPPGGN